VSRQVTRFCSKYKITDQISTPTIQKAIARLRLVTALSLTACAKSLKKVKGKWVEKPLGVL